MRGPGENEKSHLLSSVEQKGSRIYRLARRKPRPGHGHKTTRSIEIQCLLIVSFSTPQLTKLTSAQISSRRDESRMQHTAKWEVASLPAILSAPVSTAALRSRETTDCGQRAGGRRGYG
ncbi:hypothetical protein BaRGS_00013907 [Batillaria attramentaria]|uniref:Uncharacterized protein n=1 Tax=Batillaria attramentaria TaxID=370345 RepID=A0ABD0L638_9CAEN